MQPGYEPSSPTQWRRSRHRQAINGGFGMVLDGSDRVDEILKAAMLWDVMGGVAKLGLE